MKKILLCIPCFIVSCLCGQGWVHNGATVVVNNGTFIVLDGINGHYKAQSNAIFFLTGDAVIQLKGNWINNSSGMIFAKNDGKIILNGASQSIQGSAITAFPALDLKCSANPSLQSNILVGGGQTGGGNGKLSLNDKQLLLNGKRLIINNRSELAITRSTGGIVSETFPAIGYGEVQWNIRTGGAGPLYRIPFQTIAGADIPFDYNIKNTGLQTKDSGFVTISTYTTPSVSLPNNRPLPFGVPHARNEFATENARRMIDRFWVIADGGYTNKPEISLEFTYADAEHNSGTNTIKEVNMGAISWNTVSNKWNYPPKSKVNPSNNKLLLHAGQNFSGIWTFSEGTPCPIANFSTVGSCEKDSVLFADKSSVVDDTLIRWIWAYGNGNAGLGDSSVGYFSPSGIYKTRLIVIAASGCADTTYKNVNILGAPQANIAIDDSCENTSVKFTSLTSPGSGFISKEYWWFGDGSTAIGKSPSHYYGTSGLPQIKYIVYNSNLCKDTIERTLYIANKPFVYYSVKPDCEDLLFPFTNSSTAGAGTISSYNWDFGNGRKSGNRNENIVFYDSGTFKTKLIVMNSFGCRDTSEVSLRVFPRAIASFTHSPFDPKMLSPVQFNNNSTLSNNWNWDFGDGYFDLSFSPSHTYDMYGPYNVSLIANNDYNCADTFTVNIRVKSKPMFWFPTAFSPQNTEGLNDQFGLYSILNVTNYRLQIFNRYGQLLFETTNPTILWDGKVNGTLCQGGSYVYKAVFKNPENELQHFSGNVTLLR